MEKLRTNYKNGEKFYAKDLNLITSTINELGDSATPIEIQYSQLKALKNNNQLVPWKKYCITDYETTVSNYNNATSAGHKFDVIVTAIDEKTLNENVTFKHHNGDTYFADTNFSLWSGKYCFDMDSGRFDWVPSMDKKIQVQRGMNEYWATRSPELDGTGGEGVTKHYAWKCDDDEGLIFYTATDTPSVGERVDYKDAIRAIGYSIIAVKNGATQEEIDAYRGVIYGLKDEWGNECGYDFKNIQFKRYAQVDTITLDDGNVCTFNGTIVGMDNTFFEWYYNDMKADVEIRRYTMERNPTTDDVLYDDTLGTQSQNTINEISKSYVGTIESDDYQYCYPLGNGKDLDGNPFDATLNGDNNNNVFAIGDNSLNNTVIGVNCINNKFGLSFNNNTFGDFCSDNTFGNDCNGNQFGNDCYNNTFGNRCRNNHFGNNCGGGGLLGGGNTFGDYCNNNTFGNNCYNNNFEVSCYNNILGDWCNGNQFNNDYIRYFNVHNYVQNCVISGYTTGEMNYLQNVEIANFTTNVTISGLTPGSNSFVTCGKDSNGNLVTKNPFDNN